MRICFVLASAVLVLGCEEPSSAPSPAPPAPREALEAEGAQPADEVAPAVPPAPAPPERRVIDVQRTFLGHLMPSAVVRTIDGPWSIEGVVAEPGELTISALGRTFERCRRSELDHHGSATWCPTAGVVTHRGYDHSDRVWERLIVLRRGEVTWAASPCDVMHLMSAVEQASLCDEPLHPYGVSPIPGRAPRNPTCRWRFKTDRRAAAVTIRLAADAAAIEAWAEAAPGATLVESRRARTWIARGSSWTAAVRIRRDFCGDAEGAAFAARLVALAPDRE